MSQPSGGTSEVGDIIYGGGGGAAASPPQRTEVVVSQPSGGTSTAGDVMYGGSGAGAAASPPQRTEVVVSQPSGGASTAGDVMYSTAASTPPPRTGIAVTQPSGGVSEAGDVMYGAAAGTPPPRTETAVNQPPGGTSTAGDVIYGGGARRRLLSPMRPVVFPTAVPFTVEVVLGSSPRLLGTPVYRRRAHAVDVATPSLAPTPRQSLNLPQLDPVGPQRHLPVQELVHKAVVQPLQAQVALVDKAGAALFLYGPVRLVAALERVRAHLVACQPPEPVAPDADLYVAAGLRYSLASEAADPLTDLLCVWPLEEVISADARAVYQRVRAFLLRLRGAARDMQDVWVSGTVMRSKVLERRREVEVFRHAVAHFINSMLRYINWQVLDVCWRDMTTRFVTEGRDIASLRRVHDQFLQNVARRCLLQSTVSVQAADAMLDVVRRVCSVFRTNAAHKCLHTDALRELAAVRRSFFAQLRSFRAVMAGHPALLTFLGVLGAGNASPE